MSDIDTSQHRTRLLEEQERLLQAVDFLERENPGSIADELGDIVTSGDENLGDTASATYERELDQSLGEGAQQTLLAIQDALRKIEDGGFGTCEVCGNPIGAGRLAAIPGRGSASTTSARPTRERRLERYPGRLVDGRVDTGVGRGALAGGGCAPVGRFGARRGSGDRGRPGHEVRRHIDGGARGLGARSWAALDPSRPEHRHRLGLFSGATSIVVVVTAAAILWMLAFFARSAARHPCSRRRSGS